MSDVKIKRCLICDCSPSVEIDDITTVCCINDSCIMSNLEECEVEEWNTRNTPNEVLIEQNAQLKAANAELLKALNEIENLPSNRMDEGYTIAYMAIQKHKETK